MSVNIDKEESGSQSGDESPPPRVRLIDSLLLENLRSDF
jgi:hypothetical protein